MDATRRLAAVMFTDIAGYSKMMAADETGTLEFLHRHNLVLKTAIEAHRGRVVKTIGDAFMAEFSSVGDALACAAEAQRSLKTSEEDMGVAEPRRIRIGVHTGEVNVTPEGDLFGDTVNLAARLEGAAPPGGVCVSKAVVDQLRSRQELVFVAAGRRQLKNIPGETDVFFMDALGVGLGATVGSKRRRILRSSAAILLLAALSAGAWRSAQWWRAERGWRLVLDLDLKGGKAGDPEVLNAGQLKDFFSADGLLLVGLASLPIKTSLPPGPARLKVSFSFANDDYSAIELGLPHGWKAYRSQQKLFTHTDTVEGLVAWGPLGTFSAEASRSLLNFGLGAWPGVPGSPAELLPMNEKRLNVGRGPHQLVFTLAKDVLTLEGPGGCTAVSLYRAKPGHRRGESRVLIQGNSVIIHRVRLYSRQSEDEDLAGTAETYLSEGKTALALGLLDELLAKANDPVTACRLLYRKALALSGAGRLKEAAAAYLQLIDGHPDNAYTGYARVDLALLYIEASRRLGEDAESSRKRQAYGQAIDRALKDLVNKQPDHPEVWRARWLRVKNSFYQLRDFEKATADARDLFLEPRYPNFRESFQDLWNLAEFGSPEEKSRFKTLVHELLADLVRSFQHDPARLEYILFTRVLQLRVGGGDQEFSAAWLDLWNTAGLSEGAEQSAAIQLTLRSLKPERLAAVKEILRQIDRDPAASFRLRRMIFRNDFVSPLVAENVRVLRTFYALAPATALPGGKPWDLATSAPDTFGSEAAQKIRVTAGGAEFDFDSGLSWGCGFKLVSPAEDGWDLGGAKALEFEALGKKGLRFIPLLSEVGVASRQAPSFKGARGADGEQYLLASPAEPELGTGQWRKHRIDLTKALVYPSWGNQEGNRLLDLQALKAVEFSLPGHQGKGSLQIRNLTFAP